MLSTEGSFLIEQPSPQSAHGVAGRSDAVSPHKRQRAAISRMILVMHKPQQSRQGTRVIEDGRRLRLAWSDKGQQGGR